MIQSIKCLPQRHGDLSSNPQHSCKKLGARCISIIPALRRQRWEDPEDYLAIHSRRNRKPPGYWETLSQKTKIENNRGKIPVCISGLHTHTHAHMHTHDHMKTPCTHMVLHEHAHTWLHENVHVDAWLHAHVCTWSHAYKHTYVQTNTRSINNKIFLKASKQREFYINATPKDKWFPEYLKSLSFIQIQPKLSMSGSTGLWIWAVRLAKFSTNLLKDEKEAFK